MTFSTPTINLVWTGLTLASIAIITYYRNQNNINFPKNLTTTTESLSSLIQEEASEVTDIVKEKLDSVLEEFKLMLPCLENLGFSVQNFNIEVGLLPQIKTSLRGSINDVKPELIEQIRLGNPTNKLLIAILNAVFLAKNLHQSIESNHISIFKDIIIDVKLGVPPGIVINFK